MITDVEGGEEMTEETGQDWRAGGCGRGVMSDWAGRQASSAPPLPLPCPSLCPSPSPHCLQGGAGLVLLGWSFHAAIEALRTGRTIPSLHLEMQEAPQEAKDGMGACACVKRPQPALCRISIPCPPSLASASSALWPP